jgi:hypothetical protein
MIIAEIIERIQSLYSVGVSNDETRLSDRHVYNKTLTVRMQLLSQQLKKKQRMSDWNYTILPCVELIKVPSHECACLGDLGCDVYRTKFKIPRVMTDSNRHYIEYVMSIDNGMRIEETTRHYPSICEECQECIDCKPTYEHTFDIDGDLIEPLIDICVQEIIGIFGQKKEAQKSEGNNR